MSSGADSPTPNRRPRQQRGRERVDAILDATASMIAVDGLSSVTIHKIAQRSGTAIGSMYHFFPDVSAVVQALAERIEQDIQSLLLAVDAAGIDWAGLTTAKAVDAFLDPVIEYGDSHPELFEVLRTRVQPGAPGLERIDALMLELTGQIVVARLSGISKAEQTARASAILGVIGGISRRIDEIPTPPRRTMIREMKRVIVAYLNAVR
ncbi:MAG TPA: TetR/AcrR family transcriptional regulator [Gemmatimonadaceae bacterium]|jgi:AcrR family transcriptional regulator